MSAGLIVLFHTSDCYKYCLSILGIVSDLACTSLKPSLELFDNHSDSKILC